MEFLTKSDIQQMAPVVFADKASRDLSNQYVFHNTESVIDDLAQLHAGSGEDLEHRDDRSLADSGDRS